MKISITRNNWISIASVVIFLVLWKLLSLHFHSEFIVPSPEKTFKALCHLFVEKGFLSVVGTTVLRGVIGFAVAAIFGIAAGIIAGLYSGFNAYITPILVTIRSIPVIAITLLALIWFNPYSVPVFIGILTMFPMVCTNVISGMNSVDKSLVQMAEFYKVGKKRIIKELYIPAIAPFIFSGISNAFGIGWRAIIVGEVLGQPKYGIGTNMQTAQIFLNVDVLIAWTCIAVLLSYFFEILIKNIERHALKWTRVRS
ncbi:MAG: ABC transporter permease subunit [Bacteroidales bacterium]|nr:ABC transporter permease subunit [Bacteroidales bacterium]MDD3200750.1 ABC transporter permease subunit [Bacteroidales bacterium]